MKISPLSIAALMLLLSSTGLARTSAGSLQPYTGKTIKKIDIVRRNIFDDVLEKKPKSPFYYRWANAIHILTRESVVRRELLFKVGDKLDPERIMETERNLRLGDYIGEVNAEITPDGPDGVDIKVITNDLWTTQPSVFADLAGGKYSAGVDLTELNLLGYGKGIDILGQVGNDQSGYSLFYSDGRLFNTRLSLGFSVSDFTFSNGISVSLARPQYSVTVPTSFSAAYSNLHTRERLFSGGEEFFRYRNNRELLSLLGSYKIGHFTRLTFLAGGNYEKNAYSPELPGSALNHIIPPSEKISYPLVGLGAGFIQYDVERFIDAAGLPEDLTLGAGVRGTVGVSSKSFGATYTGIHPVFNVQFLAKTSSRTFIGASDNISWWSHDNRIERIRHISEAGFYYKPLETHVLVLHALTDFAWRQKSTYQVYLGGGNGLRGQSFYELAGSRSAVGNIEYRFYTPIEILTVRLGAAVFFDIGDAWRSGQPISAKALKSDCGIGLRFGMTRSAHSRVINIDLARSLSKNEIFLSFSASTSMFRLSDLNINE